MASLPALGEGRSPEQPRNQNIPGSAVSKGRGGSLAPIKEREEVIHSADLSRNSKNQIVGNPKNQAAGYIEESKQEHKRPPLANNQHRSNLEVRQRVPQSVPTGKENIVLPSINNRGARGISENKFQPPALANNGAQIMGGLHNSSSAKQLQPQHYRSGSRGSGADSRNQQMNGVQSREEEYVQR